MRGLFERRYPTLICGILLSKVLAAIDADCLGQRHSLMDA